MQDNLCCPPHRWLLGTPHAAYSRPDHKGDLVERTPMVCKLCGEERLNVVVMPPESSHAIHDDLRLGRVLVEH